MSKHKHKKEVHQPAKHPPVTKPAAPAKERSKNTAAPSSAVTKMGVFLFVLALGLYVQTLQYKFTLDDRLVIFENKLTTQGIKAIPQIFSHSYLFGSVVPDTKIYRPVSKSIYAFCWSLVGEKPMLFHLINVFFFALTGLLLFIVLMKYLPGSPILPFIIALLYVAHPIHTEVVCSIKSLDEILCFLFFLVSLYFIQAYLKSRKLPHLVAAAAGFFFSFISKESGITFLAVIPLLLFYVKADKKDIIRISGILFVVVLLVFGIRALILTGPDTNPLSDADNIMAGSKDFLTQRATAIYLLGKYILLLVFPHPLVSDYSIQQIMLIEPGSVFFILSLLFITGCFIYALRAMLKREWLGFAILFFFITISVTSNIFFLGGSHFAERFLYTPSLGFCMALGLLLNQYIDTTNKNAQRLTSRPLLLSAVVLIVLLYSIKIITQNPVWKDNISLFEHGVKTSPKSYRMHISLAQDLSDEKYVKQFPPAIREKLYQRAIDEAKTSLIYYRDIDAYDMIGNIFYITNRYDSALYYYQQGLKLVPDYESLNYHVGKALDQLQRYDEAIPYLNKALAKNPKNDGVLYNLAMSYTNKNEIDKGLEYFNRVLEINPNKIEAIYYSALIYKAKGDIQKHDQLMQQVNALGGMKNP